jgi:hydroxypyruvate reductase
MEQGAGVLHRPLVMEVLEAALRAVEPYAAVTAALRERPEVAEALTSLSPSGRVYVVGAGKAGAAMALAVEDALGKPVAGGLVVVKEGYIPTGEDAHLPKRIELVEAGHPIPDERGVAATARLLDIAERAGDGDLVVCLISGGGSALLPAPAEGLSLGDMQAVTSALLRNGATINELNAVRKHLSRVSGGRLARAAYPARVLSLILSDVTGSPLDVIASGPTAPDPTTYAGAVRVLRSRGAWDATPTSVRGHLEAGAAGRLEETPKSGDPIFRGVDNVLVATNVTSVEAAAARARQLGLNTLVVSTYVEGEARDVGTLLASIAREMCERDRPVARPACLLFGGETTVTVRGQGTGGRNSELALSAAIGLQGLGPGAIVASLATDGGDGTSPGAGGIVDGTTAERAREMGLDPRRYLEDNDSYTLLAGLGDAIVTGPTGTNVNDVMAVFAF